MDRDVLAHFAFCTPFTDRARVQLNVAQSVRCRKAVEVVTEYAVTSARFGRAVLKSVQKRREE